VVSAAKAAAVPCQGDHVNLRIQVRALDARRELARHLDGDAVPSLRPVERDARDAPVTLVDHRLEFHWRRCYSAVARRVSGRQSSNSSSYPWPVLGLEPNPRWSPPVRVPGG